MRDFLTGILALGAIGLLVLGMINVQTIFSDARVQQAFVGGSFLAIGWVTTFLLGQITLWRQRRQRALDLQEAFHVEIQDYAEALRGARKAASPGKAGAAMRSAISSLTEEERAAKSSDMQKRLQQNKQRPFIPRISAPVMFEALKEDVVLLPETVLGHVVFFYSQLSDARSLADDLISYAEKDPDPEVFARAYVSYLELRITAHNYAIIALEALDDENAQLQSFEIELFKWFGTLEDGYVKPNPPKK